MKKVLPLLLFVVSTASAQTMYKMQSPPIYDKDGTVYQLKQVFDHKPLTRDSINFLKESADYVKSIELYFKNKRGVKSYEAVVADVKVNSDGSVYVKPLNKFRSSWYKYTDANVKVGDTIWISREEAVN